MIISKNSWHYKIITEKFCFLQPILYPSNNLCLYFWSVIFRFIQGISTYLVLASPIVSLIVVFLMDSQNVPLFVGLWAFTGFIVSGITLVFALVFIGVIVVDYSNKLIKKHSPKTSKKEKKPNLFIAYIKAKKQKICPIIEFKDDE